MKQGKRRWITKADKLGNSTMLLNPTDPEASFRRKADKEYCGYVANVEESVGKNGSCIWTEYSRFCKNSNEKSLL